jgi:mono/diheme cytochrome c family protein
MKKTLITLCLALTLGGGLMVAQEKGKGKGKGKAAVAGDAVKGKEVFEANCSACHNADSEERKMGPGLKGVSKHAKLVNGESVTDATITTFVNEGGNGMPPFADLLTTAEKANVLAFLKSL